LLSARVGFGRGHKYQEGGAKVDQTRQPLALVLGGRDPVLERERERERV